MSEINAVSTIAVAEQVTYLPLPANLMSPPTNGIVPSTPCPNSTPPASTQLRDVLLQPPSSSRNTSTRRHASQRPSSQAPQPQAKPSHKPRESISSTSTSKRAINFRKPQPFVTVKTGKAPNQSTFVVHKTLIESHSPFLRNAFNGDFAEAKTQTMEMEDVSCSAFGLLVHWLYTSNIEFDPEDEEPSQLVLLADLWKLAELCGIKSLQNEVMAMLHVRVGFTDLDGMRLLSVRLYVDALPLNKNLMKRMLVERVALGSTDKELAGWMQAGGIPHGMVIDVMMTLKKEITGDQEGLYSVERYFV